MNIFVITEFPETCSLEIKEIIKKECKIFDNICLIENITEKEIARFTYLTQSSKRICIEICNFKINDFKEDVELNLKEISTKYLENVKTFKVESEHLDDYLIGSQNINKIVGEKLEKITNLKVNLTNPDIVFFTFENNHLFLGIDIIGFDMTKRPYKIASQTDALNGGFAYELIRLSGFKKNNKLLDPFAGSGMIPIEAALYSLQISSFRFENKFNAFKLNFIKKYFLEQEVEEKNKIIPTSNNIFGYDFLMKHVTGMQKNAKLAGVEKNITMSKVSIDWLDTKIDEKSIDLILTDPPKFNKRLNNEKEIYKIYEELFYQAGFILKNKGTINVLFTSEDLLEKAAKKHNFNKTKVFDLLRGEQKFKFIVFKKGE